MEKKSNLNTKENLEQILKIKAPHSFEKFRKKGFSLPNSNYKVFEMEISEYIDNINDNEEKEENNANVNKNI